MQFPNTASKLKSATTNINIASASTPSNGQVLTATSSTTATWQTPAWAWDIASTQSTFVAWENITAWNALYVSSADWKAYKTDTSNSSKINFIWFATNPVSTWWNVIADTSWVSNTQSGLTDLKLVTSNYTWFDAWWSWTYSTLNNIWQSFTLSVKSKINYYSLYQQNSTNWVFNCKIYRLSDNVLVWESWNQNYTSWAKYYTFNELYLDAGQYYTNMVLVSWTHPWFNMNTSNGYAWWVMYQWSSVYNSWYDLWGIQSFEYINWNIWDSLYLSNTWWVQLWSGTYTRRVWKIISDTAIQLETTPNDSLNWTTSTTATTWSVVLWNAVWYITVKINWVNRKIPYYS